MSRTLYCSLSALLPAQIALFSLLDELLQHGIDLVLSQTIQLHTSLHAIILAGPNPGLHTAALADQDGQRWVQSFQVRIVPLDIIPGDSGRGRVLAAMDAKLLHHLRQLPSPRHGDKLRPNNRNETKLTKPNSRNPSPNCAKPLDSDSQTSQTSQNSQTQQQ
ncbi:hypothetical protein KC19_12G086200 [Ceratodon purpureus]|uniref:Uncharacterized protein n=1 Tax=Ceratodon purpureus TaxID=3225 RepID=A0A8T0GAR7_CERPU|nr:hypothetical protein KC19_12G086200 [Ceratodon purpureus]